MLREVNLAARNCIARLRETARPASAVQIVEMKRYGGFEVRIAGNRRGRVRSTVCSSIAKVTLTS